MKTADLLNPITAVLGSIFIALGGYAKGFRDGALLNRSLRDEVRRLEERIDRYEAKIDELEREIETLRQENAELRAAPVPTRRSHIHI